ncbi:MAG: putative DNA-binding domain-containing protein [Alphaproteobacteria bacterium]|nr:putative DNA-binding domain-containing protein [Alphaproteobacteria bacterium]
MGRDLPDDWRERTIAMIRGAEPLRADWFTPGPELSAEQRIAIHLEQFRLRVEGAVRTEIPGLVHLMGEESEGWIRAYLAACPPTSWTLHQVAEEVAGWLATQDVPSAWVEMAELDRAVNRGFEAADTPPVTVEELGGSPRLALAPHVTLLRLRWSVHRVRSAVMTGGEPPAPEEGHFPLVVFRRGLKMRHWEVPVGLFALLEGLGEGNSVAGAIDHAFRGGHVDLATLQAEIGGWFREMSERSLVRVVV